VSEYSISEHPNTYVVHIIYTAVSKEVDQKKCAYGTMPKGSMGHILYIFIKTLNWGCHENTMATSKV